MEGARLTFIHFIRGQLDFHCLVTCQCPGDILRHLNLWVIGSHAVRLLNRHVNSTEDSDDGNRQRQPGFEDIMDQFHGFAFLHPEEG